MWTTRLLIVFLAVDEVSLQLEDPFDLMPLEDIMNTCEMAKNGLMFCAS